MTQNNVKFKFWCPQIKFYWNITMLIHLYTTYGYFHGTKVELSSCER